jgi:DNA-binding ferritin-like protein (Dps family)
MVVPPTPPGGNPSQPNVDPTEVRQLDEMALKWANILRLKREINKADEAHKDLYSEITKLQGQEAQNALRYKGTVASINQLERNLQTFKAQGNRQATIATQRLIDAQKAQQEQLAKTVGGALRAQEVAAAKQKASLQAERQLIKDINKERGVGGKLMDMFRSKEARQRQIDISRTKVGGGINQPQGGKGGTGGGESTAPASVFGPRTLAVLGAMGAAVKALSTPLKAVGNAAKDALVAPFADAAGLLTGEDYGMGGGKLKTSGPGSILGGIEKIAGSIPLIGGFLSTAVGFVKTIVEGILGVEQGVFRFARAMNLSFGQASRMKGNFEAIAASSGHIAINFARMAQSQVELTKSLGINQELSGDILKNDVLLRDVLGVELAQRQAIANTSVIAQRNAVKLTQSLMGTVINFNKITKTGYSFNGIMEEASKLSGVVGLKFAMYPEKIAKTLMTVKTLGFSLQQLQSTASGFLDFESSISKEIEAQVITGKEMNLTKAREAALNNDYATLAKEIAKNVGKASTFIGMQRIDQEAVAESVGMTADSLADVLKNQELYSQLGADDLKTFNQRVALLEKQGKTQEQITKLIGEDAYNSYTQVSTAERISEVIEKVKRTFVDFMAKSGLFDFLTKPEKIENFIKGLADKLASVIDIIGSVIAGILRGIAAVAGFFSESTGRQLRNVATSVEYGTGTFAGGLRASTSFLGGEKAPSVGGTVEAGAKQEQAAKTSSRGGSGVEGSTAYQRPIEINLTNSMDGEVMSRRALKLTPSQYGVVMS